MTTTKSSVPTVEETLSKLFKKKAQAIDPQQALIQNFPRTVNSLSQRIQLLTNSLALLDQKSHRTDLNLYSLNDITAVNKELHKQVIQLKEEMHNLNRLLNSIMEDASTKATKQQLDRLTSLADSFNPAEILTRHQFVHMLE